MQTYFHLNTSSKHTIRYYLLYMSVYLYMCIFCSIKFATKSHNIYYTFSLCHCKLFWSFAILLQHRITSTQHIMLCIAFNLVECEQWKEHIYVVGKCFSWSKVFHPFFFSILLSTIFWRVNLFITTNIRFSFTFNF